ncbi:MAG: ABC transporter substrate-binding protein [Holosporaceae bacterium]|jgi:polar amino acid transport system substrate-binding protein|nr:ABC transporter substrate-binding protein [Holosporaceae bacterium]
MKCCFARIFVALCLLVSGCEEKEDGNLLKVATCADYPPFEYYQDGEHLVGFDIELMEAVAKKLKKNVVFKDMAFGSILTCVENGSVDAAVSAMNPSDEKRKKFDFSNEYCKSSLFLIYKKDNQVTDITKVGDKKIACQLGCLMHEQFVKEKAPRAERILTDKVDAAIESLKTGHVDYVVADAAPAREFCKKNPELTTSFIADNSEGYAILLKKNAPLKNEIDGALDELRADGTIGILEAKYLNK